MAFEVNDSRALWAGALWWWADTGGDLRMVAALLRQRVPLDPAHAVLLADILDGAIVPKTAHGGPGVVAQRLRWLRDLEVRGRFDAALLRIRSENAEKGVRRARTRDDAAEVVAEELTREGLTFSGRNCALSADEVLKIVSRKPPKLRSFGQLVVKKP